jgi:transmembrane sensor
MNTSEIIAVIKKYKNGLLLTEEEAILLRDWTNSVSSEEFHQTLDRCEGLPSAFTDYKAIPPEFTRKLETLLDDLDSQDRDDKYVPFYVLNWKKWVTVAASIILLLSAGTYIWKSQIAKSAIARTNTQKKNDLPPGHDAAILTLADGTTIVLDSARNGQLVRQGSAQVVKSNGQLSYQAENKGEEVVYNIMATPRGGQYQLILPDGSKVWLNAASSIRYPTVFQGRKRQVELTGEGYFEVERGKTPFIVSIIPPAGMTGEGGEVQVLGTHFNINAYGDDGGIRTTLLEGAVKLVKGNEGILLTPGQQAEYRQNGRPELVKDADMDEALAWRNGVFQFNEASIETVMKQVERWYDIDVSYEGKIPAGHFSGTVNRNANISQILKILELSNVHYRIEGRRMIIIP